MSKYVFIVGIMLALAGCRAEDAPLSGYVEGEFVAVAPTTGGLLQDLSVERGQQVTAGAALFALDRAGLQSQVALAQADVKRAQAELADLTKGDRPEEMNIIIKQKEQAQATLANAKKEYDRIAALNKAAAESAARRDAAQAVLKEAQARVDELDAKIKAADLGARTDRIEAARQGVEIAAQTLVQAEKAFRDAAPIAPADGLVDDTYFRPGEYVAAGQPVVNLLPPENIKVRFFVSQKVAPSIRQGDALSLTCDGCAVPIPAHVTYIASEAEFTPPVIFSVGSRDKLVFLIEAKPDTFNSALHPGLPVDIALGHGP